MKVHIVSIPVNKIDDVLDASIGQTPPLGTVIKTDFVVGVPRLPREFAIGRGGPIHKMKLPDVAAMCVVI
jgi:hypothetical protein